MNKAILLQNVTSQLANQELTFEILNESEAKEITKKWDRSFIGKNRSPFLKQHKWHIFSYKLHKSLEGEKAAQEYEKQFPSDIYIFNESLNYCLKIKKSKIPLIREKRIRDDIYICHHNMKWTYIITHESPEFGPYFCNTKA